MESEFATLGLTSFSFGVFSAYWAKQTGRDVLVWLLFGMFLPPFAGIYIVLKLLAKEENT